MNFKDKIILVTGSSRGIGAAIAKRFAESGATLIINYKENEEAAKKVLDDINEKGIVVRADVGNSDDVNRMFAKVQETYGKIDVLVNNAGIVRVTPFKKLKIEEWKSLMNVNMMGTFLCSQRAVDLMNKGSAIVNISSIRGLFDHGRPSIIDYSASKAAVISFTKTLAKEVAPDIRVNAVAPGMTMTDIAKSMPEEDLERFAEDIYLKRLIRPDEVANAVVFLASKEASGITGTILMVDGGQSLSK